MLDTRCLMLGFFCLLCLFVAIEIDYFGGISDFSCLFVMSSISVIGEIRG